MNNFPLIHYTTTDKFAGIARELEYNAKGEQVRFVGYPKIDGMNGGFTVRASDLEVRAQTRENLLSKDNDVYGFHAWASEQFPLVQDFAREVICRFLPTFAQMFPEAFEEPSGDPEDVYVQLFGEWCGHGGIAAHKNMAISKIGRNLYMPFAARLVIDPKVNEDKSFWLTVDELSEVLGQLFSNFDGIVLPKDFQDVGEVREIVLDQSNIESATEALSAMTMAVENRCPLASMLGVTEGYGEGLVWSPVIGPGTHLTLLRRIRSKGLRFKTKGPKTSVVKTKKVVEVDTTKVAGVESFLEYAVTENRMTQMLREHINEQMPDTIPKVMRTKDFIARVAADVFKEETEALTRAGLTPADVTGGINRIARNFYVETCKQAENWPI